MANKKKENESVPSTPYSRLDVYKELQAIKDRVSNALESYEESGPTLSYTNDEVEYVKHLIAKFEENRRQKKSVLKAVNSLCKAQLEKFEEFDSEFSTNEVPSGLLKDIQDHEFRNAYDVALQSVDKLRHIMSFAAKPTKGSESLSTKSSGVVQATEGQHNDNGARERRKSLSVKSDYTSTYLQLMRSETKKFNQEKELTSLRAAHRELLSEKQRSTDTISELKKELNKAHKEVDTMQKILKIQQNTAKHRKMSTTYYDITYDETLLRDLDNQPKRLAKNRNMSSSTTSSSDGYNEEDLANKQKDHSTTSDSSLYSSSSSNDDLKTPSKKHEVAFDVHMHKDRSNKNGLGKNNRITTKLQPVVNVKSKNDEASSQQKIGSRLPDIHCSKAKTGNNLNTPKSRDSVKLPELNLKSGNSSKSEVNTVDDTPDNGKRSEQADHMCKQQPPSPKGVAKILLDLHDKEQLTINQIQENQKEVLNTLIKGPVHDFTEEEQLDKAAKVTVEYVNMSQLFNKLGQILKEHCKQDNESYQMDLLLPERDSRNAIKKHYSWFVEGIISTVESADKQMRINGIFGNESFTRVLKEQLFDPDPFPENKLQQQNKDVIATIANALEMISHNCKLYVQDTKQLITEQEKRLSSLQKANPQVYQKCIMHLRRVSQFPYFIDESIEKGCQQIGSMLENYIVKVQSAIKTFNFKRDLLITETKSKMQSYIPEIIKTVNKISTSCIENGHDAMIDGLQNSLRQLNKLCKSVQIVREYSANVTEEVPPSFLEQSKSVITEVQGQVKNIISSKLGVEMPDQFDFEVIGNSINDTVKQPTAVLPTLSSRCVQNLTGLSYNEPFHRGQLSISSNDQRSNRSRCNSMWGPLMHPSPLVAIEESSNQLAKGIKGVPICRQIHDNRPMTTSRSNAQHKSRLPILHLNDRRWHQDIMGSRVKITINNKTKKHSGGKRADPLECFKITSLSYKRSK